MRIIDPLRRLRAFNIASQGIHSDAHDPLSSMCRKSFAKMNRCDLYPPTSTVCR
jgi:hypothetical protein